MPLSFKCLLSADQILDSDINILFNKADHYTKQKKKGAYSELKSKVLATLFFEPSTRTRFSFEKAMYQLGGEVISLEQGGASSINKGESLLDMGQVMSEYADIIVMRHPTPYSVDEFSKHATVPVINAGDGPNQHPTQSLVDLYTIYKEKKRINNLNITFLGDLKYSRTIHSLIKLLIHYNNSFSFISHKSLKIPDELKKEIIDAGCTFKECEQLTGVLTDVLYVTRVQQERFESEEAYNKVKDLYILNKEDLAANPDIIVLHPLPRVNEIDTSVDSLPCAKYFKQIKYSIFIRMALLSSMIESN
jgi:aspartate carbamoyltransferase catalytic subunit